MRKPDILLAKVVVGLLCFNLTILNSNALADDTFRFNPPDGTTFAQTVKTSKSSSMGPMMGRSEDGELVTKYTITKTAEGYRMVGRQVSHTMTRDGNKTSNPVVDILKEVVITTNLDNDGRAVSVEGYDKFIQKMNENLPPEALQMAASMFNEEAMAKKAIAEWNGRIGDLAGRSCKVGETWTSTDEYEMPGGSPMKFYTAFKIMEKVNRNGHDCVRIEFFYNSDPAALTEFIDLTVGEIMDETDEDFEMPDINVSTISGSGERIIDPSTMLVYYEKMTRSMKMEMNIQGQQQKMEMVSDETRESIFDYE